MRKLIFFQATLFLLFASYKKSDTASSSGSAPAQVQQKLSGKKFLAYSFLKINNPGLGVDISGNIVGDTIFVLAPAGTLKTMIAAFSNSDKSIVYVGNLPQQNNVTNNDFSSTVHYTVVAEDSTSSDYFVKVNYPVSLSSQKALLSFGFQKANNPIPVDATGVINNSQVTVFLPPGTALTTLKASFTVSPAAKVSAKGQPQNSGTTTNDFSQPVVYRVTAKDGSSRDYTVSLITDMASIDNVVKSLMSAYQVPALSLAITKDENLVYAKAYGLADKENTEPATPRHLFRIASLSKQITSIVIMKLLDLGKINLDNKVFGPDGILGTQYGTQPYGTNITQITVRELLQHTSGGWSNDGSDPMFTNPALTADQLISWALDNRPLTNVPGTTYAYSNFGYCILGRVIEKITGMSYEKTVQSLLLAPLGITDMTIGGNTPADRLPREVKYYGQNSENPYVYNIRRMDAHGGWVATATDLARILVHIDGFPKKTDVLSAGTVTKMATPSSANANYACGWSVNSSSNWWHTGSLPGTATEQARTSLGYNFVILTNTRSLDPNFVSAIDQLFWTALNNTPVWPTYDLF